MLVAWLLIQVTVQIDPINFMNDCCCNEIAVPVPLCLTIGPEVLNILPPQDILDDKSWRSVVLLCAFVYFVTCFNHVDGCTFMWSLVDAL